MTITSKIVDKEVKYRLIFPLTVSNGVTRIYSELSSPRDSKNFTEKNSSHSSTLLQLPP